MTDAERRIWRLLREAFPEARFRRQVPIRHFIADFASHGARLVVEIDGGQHAEERDSERTRIIEAEGYRVIRVWNHDASGNPEGVIPSSRPRCMIVTPTQPPSSRGRGSKVPRK